MSLLAQVKIPGSSTGLVQPSGVAPVIQEGGNVFVGALTQTALDWIAYLAIFLTIVYVMWSGIQIITSQADPERLSAARRRLTFAIIGLVVVVSAFLIVKFIIVGLGGNSEAYLTPYSGLVQPAPGN